MEFLKVLIRLAFFLVFAGIALASLAWAAMIAPLNFLTFTFWLLPDRPEMPSIWELIISPASILWPALVGLPALGIAYLFVDM